MTRKAQIQINETIIVLFIFILIVIFGVVFFAKFQRVNVESERKSTQDLDLIKVSQIISSLPELSCSEGNVQKDNCYDILKIEVFTKILEDNPEYFVGTQLCYTNITIRQYDPFNDVWPKTWYLYYSPLKGADTRKVFVPAILYNKITTTKYFGIVELTWYAQ